MLARSSRHLAVILLHQHQVEVPDEAAVGCGQHSRLRHRQLSRLFSQDLYKVHHPGPEHFARLTVGRAPIEQFLLKTYFNACMTLFLVLDLG